MSITHNEKRIHLLNVPSSCISAQSETQILSIKDECTYRFSNFLIIVLCNTFANCCVAKTEGCLLSDSIAAPLSVLGDFLSNNL